MSSKRPSDNYDNLYRSIEESIKSYENTINDKYLNNIEKSVIDDYKNSVITPSEIIKLYIDNNKKAKDILQQEPGKAPFFNEFGFFINMRIKRYNGKLTYPKITFYPQLMRDKIIIADRNIKDAKDSNKFYFKIRTHNSEILKYYKDIKYDEEMIQTLNIQSIMNFVAYFILHISFLYTILDILEKNKKTYGVFENNNYIPKDSKIMKSVNMALAEIHNNVQIMYYDKNNEEIYLQDPLVTYKLELHKFEAINVNKNSTSIDPLVMSLDGTKEIIYKGKRLNRSNIQEYITSGSTISFDAVFDSLICISKKIVLKSIVKKIYIKRYKSSTSSRINIINQKFCEKFKDKLETNNEDEEEEEEIVNEDEDEKDENEDEEDENEENENEEKKNNNYETINKVMDNQ